jgi:hypothetical protein
MLGVSAPNAAKLVELTLPTWMAELPLSAIQTRSPSLVTEEMSAGRAVVEENAGTSTVGSAV